MPLEWALCTADQGVAFMLVADRLGDATKAQAAIRQIESAIAVMREGGNTGAAAYYAAQLRKPARFSID